MLQGSFRLFFLTSKGCQNCMQQNPANVSEKSHGFVLQRERQMATDKPVKIFIPQLISVYKVSVHVEGACVLTKESHLSFPEGRRSAERGPDELTVDAGSRIHSADSLLMNENNIVSKKAPAQVKYKDSAEKLLLSWVIYCIICTETGNKPP